AAEVLPRTHHERLQLRSLRELHPGPNPGQVVLCRPLVFVAPPLNASGTLYLVCVDTGGCVFVLSLAHVHHDAFDMTALLAVLHPQLRNVDTKWPPPPPSPPPVLPPPPPPPPSQQQQKPQTPLSETAAAPATTVAAPAAPAPSSRTYRFPMLLVGVDLGCRSCVLV
ncbi:hypothetical protein Agub_g9851, partial [Astrephomene gubernaculifera]